jgi:uncharacterized protein
VIVLIEQIPEGGLTVEDPFKTEALAQALAQGASELGYRAARGGTLRAHLQRVGRGVLLEGKLDPEVVGPCKRCLTEVSAEVPVSFTLNLIPKPPVSAEEREDGAEDDHKRKSGGSFDLADADEELFDGKTIDLDPIVREQVLLALPMYVVCKEECRGLCSICGQNLNEKECGCERKAVDPRLAVLKDIKLN